MSVFFILVSQTGRRKQLLLLREGSWDTSCDAWYSNISTVQMIANGLHLSKTFSQEFAGSVFNTENSLKASFLDMQNLQGSSHKSQ